MTLLNQSTFIFILTIEVEVSCKAELEYFLCHGHLKYSTN